MSQPGLNNYTFLIGGRNEHLSKSKVLPNRQNDKNLNPKIGQGSHMEKVKFSDYICSPEKDR